MKLLKVLLPIASLLITLSSCSSVSSGIQSTYTPYPTYTQFPPNEPLPTYTQYPTLVPYPTYTNYPQPTEVPPTETPAFTNTPKPTNIPEPTTNPELTTDKTEGVWLVGSEVAAGLWRASGDCYAVTRDKKGDQLDMASGSRSIITVPSSAFTVEFVSYPDNCTWTYLGK